MAHDSHVAQDASANLQSLEAPRPAPCCVTRKKTQCAGHSDAPPVARIMCQRPPRPAPASFHSSPWTPHAPPNPLSWRRSDCAASLSRRQPVSIVQHTVSLHLPGLYVNPGSGDWRMLERRTGRHGRGTLSPHLARAGHTQPREPLSTGSCLPGRVGGSRSADGVLAAPSAFVDRRASTR